MICLSCGKGSQHVHCPYCEAPTIASGRIMVGFAPFSAAFDLGRSLGQKISGRGQEPAPSPSAPTQPSIIDRLTQPSIIDRLNPVKGAGEAIDRFSESVSGITTVLGWLFIGGVVVGAVVLAYGAIKAIGFAPEAFRATGSRIDRQTEAVLRILPVMK